MEWKDVLSVYAAVLSTGVFFWTVSKSRRWIRVRVVHGSANIDGQLQHGVWVSIENASDKPMYIRAASVLYKFRKSSDIRKFKHLWRFRRWPVLEGWVHTSPTYQEIKTGLPLEIKPGDSHGFLMIDKPLLQLTKNRIDDVIVVSVQDALGRDYRSNIFEFKEVNQKVHAA